MKKGFVFAFAAVLCLAASIDAGCGGSGRVGIFGRRADHRQLRLEHRQHNAAMRGSCGTAAIIVMPTVTVEKVAAPVAVLPVFGSGTCADGSCGTSARLFRRR